MKKTYESAWLYMVSVAELDIIRTSSDPWLDEPDEWGYLT